MRKHIEYILIAIAAVGLTAFAVMLASTTLQTSALAQTNCNTIYTFPNGDTLVLCSAVTDTPVPEPTATETSTDVPHVTETVTSSPPPTVTQGAAIPPFVGAPQCPDTGANHDNWLFHTLWDSGRGCHYDHEHGVSPFVADVEITFPSFDIAELLGGVQIGHSNPSSPMENTHKHGGFKWDVALNVPLEIFEGAQFPVRDAVIQYHAFGDSSIELETRIHSTVALVTVCDQIGRAHV